MDIVRARARRSRGGDNSRNITGKPAGTREATYGVPDVGESAHVVWGGQVGGGRWANPQIKMAPIRSIKKQTNRAKPSAGSGVSLPKPSLVDDDFRTTKRDKRLIKHSSFVSKIEKTSAKSGKRRRASKKLVANLESLADALPEAESNLNDPSQLNIIKQKTLKHRPGAMKRKEKLEKSERDRFAKNMAQMSNLPTAPTSNSEPAVADSMSNRWAALRGFISNTMEHQPAFKTNK